jgi:hypothetical protein
MKLCAQALLLPLLLLAQLHCAQARVVYLFRHCVRSVNSSKLAPFAARPFPSFGVPPDFCLPRGLQLLEAMGARLLSGHGGGDENENNDHAAADGLVIIADNVPRNIDSMYALGRGLGLARNASTRRQLVVDGSAFAHCKAPDAKTKQALVEARFEGTPLPPNASAAVGAIAGVLAGGSGGSIDSVPDSVQGGDFSGVHPLAASAATSFLMQLGGGLEVGWGAVSAADVYRYDAQQVYDWAVTRRAVPIEQAKSSPMLKAVLGALGLVGGSGGGGGTGEDAAPHTTIFMGHDTDVNGVGTLLDLGWQAPPFADNTTAPSVALRFETLPKGRGVAITFVYPDYADLDAPLYSTQVHNDSVAAFCSRALRHLDWKCAGSRPVGGLCPNDRA